MTSVEYPCARDCSETSIARLALSSLAAYPRADIDGGPACPRSAVLPFPLMISAALRSRLNSSIRVAYLYSLLGATIGFAADPTAASAAPSGAAPYVVNPSSKETPAPSPADIAWKKVNLASARPKQDVSGVERRMPEPNWAQASAQARDFREKFPDDPRATAALKLELLTLLKLEQKNSETTPETAKLVQTYLMDKSRPAADRIEVRIASEELRLGRLPPKSRADELSARSQHARSLIAEFPEQPEGYGHMLALAKSESPENARILAKELLAAPGTPEKVRQGAQRVLGKVNLLGKPLSLSTASEALAAAKGKPVVIYTWSCRRDNGFLDLVRRLSVGSSAVFIGINLDENSAVARTAATDLKLPGTQIYDGNGLEGPAARQLQLTMVTALYLVDRQGVLQDVNGHIDPRSKITRFTAGKGGQP